MYVTPVTKEDERVSPVMEEDEHVCEPHHGGRCVCMVCTFKALVSSEAHTCVAEKSRQHRRQRGSRLFRSPTGELANSPREKKKKSSSEIKTKIPTELFYYVDSNVETELISVDLEISKATNLVSLTEWLRRKLSGHARHGPSLL